MLDFESVARVIIDAPCAWLTESAIAAALGAPEAELSVAVAGLVAGRLLDRWARPDGPVVILTALGASQLGVRLVETAGAEVYRWSRDAASVRSTRPTRRSIERTEAHDAALRQASASYAQRRMDRPSRPAKTEPPKPRVILWGTCAVPWDEPRRWRPRPDEDGYFDVRCQRCRRRKRRGAPAIAVCRPCGFGLRPRSALGCCPACGDRRLPAEWYCLRCDRWGLDGYFGRRGFRKSRRPEPRRKAG
jgi:hypothetical protein